MNNRSVSILLSLAVTLVIMFVFVFAYSWLLAEPDSNPILSRLLMLVGGKMPLGLIQGFTFFLFFYAIFEIFRINRRVAAEEIAFATDLLPEKENWVITPGEVARLKLDVLSKTKHHRSLLSSLIVMVCNKFRANKSTSESLSVLSSQVKINKENDESEQSLIRYVTWAVPSVGFIGTVIGIANSLGSVRQNMSSSDLVNVTTALNVAFDTTLLALTLSLIMMFFYHRLQERVEKFHAHCEQYVLDNLINRIYHS